MLPAGHDSAMDVRDRWSGVRKRPALSCAILFMTGIAVSRWSGAFHELFLSLLLTAIAGAMIWWTRPRISEPFIGIALVLAGLLASQQAMWQFPSNEIASFTTEQRRLAWIELEIDQPVRTLTYPFDQARALPPRQTTLARVRAIKTWDGWKSASGRVFVQIAQPHPRLRAGQVVRAVGMLERPSPSANPGQFDWLRYYRDQRILTTLQIASADAIRILDDGNISWLGYARETVRERLAVGFRAEQSLDHALLRALLLGDHDPEMRDVQEQFRRTGTSHHIVISGMHVAIVGGFVFLLCRLLRTSPRFATLFAMGVIALYGLLALPSPPVVRSVMLGACIALAISMGRGVDVIQLLSLSVLAMLIYHPPDLFNAGFQLSFGTVLGLILFTYPVMNALAGREHGGAVPVTHDPIIRAGRWMDQQLLAGISASLVAWGVSIPLIAMHFSQLNPWAAPGSLVLAPIVLLALVCGMLKVVLSFLLPGAAETWAYAAQQPIALMRWTVDWLARLPGGDVPLPAPPLWLVAAFYLSLYFAVTIRGWPGTRWVVRSMPVILMGVILLGPWVTGKTGRLQLSGELRLTILSVGAGQCAVIEPPGGRVVIIDAGSMSMSDPLRRAIKPFLRHAGWTRVDTVVMSHANADHYSAVAEIVAGYDVREVLVGEWFVEDLATTPIGEALLRDLDRMERPPRRLRVGDRIPLGRGTELRVIWPTEQERLESNDNSLVMKLTHAGTSVLFSGDIQEVAMRRLLSSPADLSSAVLIAPHHGSTESSTRAFIDRVNPIWVVSSNDRTLSQKQKNLPGLVGGRELLRTHEDGAVTIVINAEGRVTVESFLRRRRP
jgi:competence protein ComEC